MLAVTLLVLAAALVLDRLVGDPPALWGRLPHPVALIGRLVGWLDSRLNRESLAAAARRRRGVAVTVGLAAGAGVLGLAVHRVLAAVPFGMAVETLIVAVFLAQKSLIDHVEAVGRALLSGGVGAGRRAVAQIVGRDVTSLDEAGIARAAMESAAENFSDGLVAPVFWYALLGLPGLLIYKAANTANSMIGHRSARYEAFGWAAARFDDALNFVPARLSALLVAAAAAIYRLRRPACGACGAPRRAEPQVAECRLAGGGARRARSAWRSAARGATARWRSTAPGSTARAAGTSVRRTS